MSLHILLCLLCPITGHNEIYRHSIIIDSHGLWQYIDIDHIFSFICYVLLKGVAIYKCIWTLDKRKKRAVSDGTTNFVSAILRHHASSINFKRKSLVYEDGACVTKFKYISTYLHMQLFKLIFPYTYFHLLYVCVTRQ